MSQRILPSTRSALAAGMRDGLPIGLGYLAVSFSLGIAARNAGLTPLQSFLASVSCNASAGEYAGFTVITQRASLLELVLMTLVANARYLLMSCALSQRLAPGTGTLHRFAMPFAITDEIFAASLARPGFLEPAYLYGAILVASPCWGTGTALGCLAGELLPGRVVSALSVALFGMFLAVIVPPARRNRVIGGLILLCFASSWACGVLPGVSRLSPGLRTVLLTLLLSALAALLFPHPQQDPGEEVAA